MIDCPRPGLPWDPYPPPPLPYHVQPPHRRCYRQPWKPPYHRCPRLRMGRLLIDLSRDMKSTRISVILENSWCLGYEAFQVDDLELCKEVRENIVMKLRRSFFDPFIVAALQTIHDIGNIFHRARLAPC